MNDVYLPAISSSDSCLLWTFSTAMMKSSSVVVLSSSGRLGFLEDELRTLDRALSQRDDRADCGLHSGPSGAGGPRPLAGRLVLRWKIKDTNFKRSLGLRIALMVGSDKVAESHNHITLLFF